MERLSIALATAAAAVLRVLAVFRYRIDSDEPQHLHIVWGWTHGLVQYRDVFDNHMPLFHVLCVPLLRLLGERADTLIAMRLAMLPLYAIAIVLTHRIAAIAYGRRAAMWAAVVASLIPGFLLWSTEFRTDDLWTVFWLWAVWIAINGRLTTSRVCASGFVLGLAMAVSAKTTLLFIAFLVGAAASRQLRWKSFAIFLTAFATPPAALVVYFASRGALSEFFYGVVIHNLSSRSHPWRWIVFPLAAAAVLWIARRVADSPTRVFLFVTAHFYAVAMYCLWPLVEHEHWLPYFPLAAVTIVPLLRIRHVMAIVLIEILLVFAVGQLWQDQTGEELAVIQQTLDLTRPDETVMDLKGEAVFRKRAFYYVLEPFTKHRIRAGQIADSVIPDILRTRTMVVTQDHYGFPHAARKFLRRNFVSVGAVRAAGKILQGPSFEVEVPGDYAVLDQNGSFAGSLDGTPYSGPRHLESGMHSVAPAGSYALLWARAAERGLTPFGLPEHKLSRRPHVRRDNKEKPCAKRP